MWKSFYSLSCGHALLSLAGAASDATTVHYPDAVAIANAKKGCEAQKKHDAMVAAQRAPATPCANTRPTTLVRVNSVPVLTPPTKIHRTFTPPAAGPVVGNNAEHAEAMDTATGSGNQVVTYPASTTPESQTKKKKSKNKRLRRLQKQQSLEEQDQQDMTTEATQTNAVQQHSSDTTAVQPAQEAAPSEAVPTPNDQESPTSAAPTPDGQEPATSATAPKKKKMAARKAAARAPATVKTEPLVRTSTEQEMQAAQAANLQRANTAAQQTPSPTPARSAPAHAPQQQLANPGARAPSQSESGASASTEYPPSDDDLENIEKALDREIKKEQTDTRSAATSPGGNGTPSAAQGDEQPTKRIRREKTAAEKAAHARYMRFSRSFERTLGNKKWHLYHEYIHEQEMRVNWYKLEKTEVDDTSMHDHACMQLPLDL